MENSNNHINDEWGNALYKRIMMMASDVEFLKAEVKSLKLIQQKYNENPLIDYQIEKIYGELRKNDVEGPVNAVYDNKKVIVYPCDPKYCTGCMACIDACKTKAIYKIQDKEGFYKVKIDVSKCINCNSCISKCHNNFDLEMMLRNPILSYACKNNDIEKRTSSSSGGIFVELGEIFTKNGGVVVGAAYDEKFIVRHMCVHNDGIKKLVGSKYVQSDMENIYGTIKESLESGKRVLFTGTPCQVSAIRNFFGYNKDLYTIDLVCHGVPSPMIFEEYKKQLEKLYGRIKDIRFRSKVTGWKKYSIEVLFEDGSKYLTNNIDDMYFKGFLQDYTNNPVCHRCRYADIKRVGDITLCDLWGYEGSELLEDDDKGISGVLVNSIKGQEMFKMLERSIKYVDYDIEKIKRGNHCLNAPSLENCYRTQFWECFEKRGLQQAAAQFFK